MFGEVGEERGPSRGGICRDTPPMLCQAEAEDPPIDGIAPALDPAAPLEVGDQPADGALLEPEATPKLTLGQRFVSGELGQRVRHRRTHGLAARRSLNVEQTEGPHEPHHPTLQLFAIAHAPRLSNLDGCIVQRN
jgi:hypothetical protein